MCYITSMKKRRKSADFSWFKNPYVVSANCHDGHTQGVLAHLLFSEYFGGFDARPLAALSLSLGDVSEEEAEKKLNAISKFLFQGILKRTPSTSKAVVKGFFSPKEVNELAEAQVEAMGFIDMLKMTPSSEIVLATNQVHDTLLSLGHHRPAAYLSEALEVEVGAIHFRIDAARRRLKEKKRP